MLRSPSAVLLATLFAVPVAHAGVTWTVGSDANYDFYNIHTAVSDTRVQDGDSIRIFSGGYLGFDSGDKALRFEPGNSPGIVDVFGSMFLRQNSVINFEIGGYNSGLSGGAPDFDQFIVTGNVNLVGDLEITLFNGFSPNLGDSWAIVQSGGSIAYTGVTTFPQLGNGLSWNIQVVAGSSEFGGSGSSLIVSVVPTPGAAALIGLAGLIGSRRRRN
jgi:MYXO-CTERM domain-containing protein